MPAGSAHGEITHRGRLLTVEVRSYADGDGRDVVREIVHHPGAVVIVPVLDDDRVVLIRNHRIAVDETLWELPAGTMEPGEVPAVTAARELAEETGYEAARISPLAEFYTSPGFCDELLHVFVAEDLSFVGQKLEAGETIEAHPLPRGEVLEMIADGRIRDAKTIAGVLRWDRSRDAGGAAS
ncbi:MAG: NUDIX hydrolase [Planctomycetota bacterium]|jgi:ADP-ribose pyrophosphatase